jgi:hypothetical protein
MTAARTSYAQAIREYDPTFERTLVEEITLAIGRASICSDADVLALRTGETASALLTVFAATLALSPEAARSPTAIRKTVDELAKRLRLRVAKAQASAEVQDFARRCFHGNDVGGSA